MANDQSQSSTTTSNIDESFNNSIDDKLKEMEKMFQSKISLMEKKHEENAESKDALQKELAALKQKELDQQEENKRLKERLARMEAGIQSNTNNDLNYGSSDDKIDDENDSNHLTKCSNDEDKEDDTNATAKSNVTDENNSTLQNVLPPLKQATDHQYGDTQLLQERLVITEAGIQDDPNNDPYYDSSDNENDNEIVFNYDSECSNGEEDNNVNKHKATTQKGKNQYHLIETYADPNYDSSDNEDPRNDIYLD
jgi:hypothetical protein